MERTVLNALRDEQSNGVHGGLYHRMQVDFAYNSNHIEGSRLTHDQTRLIYETQTIGETALVNDVIETVNHFRCFDRILQTAHEPVTEEYIKELHRMLKNGVMLGRGDTAVIGDYKRYANTVGKITTAKPKEVPEKIRLLLERFAQIGQPDLYDIAKFHADFEQIHPFYDGNGRIGRLLIFKQCLAADIVPFYISDFNKMFYYLGLQEWQTEDKPMRLLDVFLSAQDDMSGVLDYFDIVYPKQKDSARTLLMQHGLL